MGSPAPPPGHRPRVDLWWFTSLVLEVPPMTIARAVAPSAATREDVLAAADLLSKRPLAWAWGLGPEQALALQRLVELHRDSKRRK